MLDIARGKMPGMRRRNVLTLPGLIAGLAVRPARARPGPGWRSLFDGKRLAPWKAASFGGEGPCRIEKGAIRIYAGDPISGITWAGGDLPRRDYEIVLEAMRVSGGDFFCALTFPVGTDPCTLVVGGWSGPVVGLSNIDDRDASENETTTRQTFQNGRWYRIRLRVAGGRIQAWIDEAAVVDVATAGRKISIRPEVAPCRPLGIATYLTTAAIRGIRLREV